MTWFETGFLQGGRRTCRRVLQGAEMPSATQVLQTCSHSFGFCGQFIFHCCRPCAEQEMMLVEGELGMDSIPEALSMGDVGREARGNKAEAEVGITRQARWAEWTGPAN